MTPGKLFRKEEIQSTLATAISRTPYLPQDAASATPSAVLVIIHYHGARGLPHVFLTRRSSTVKSHKGEVSFPGGRFARTDRTLLGTALRETREEIGITFSPDQVLGSLQAVRTMTSNHFIVPFVTVQDRLPAHSISGEVDTVLDAPLLQTLMTIEQDSEHYRLAKDAFRFTYENNVIWGATARIMKQLYDLLVK